MRTEEQHAVHIAQDGVEAPQRPQAVAQRGRRPRQAGVVREAREGHVVGDAVRGPSGRRIQAADQDEAVHAAPERTGEENEGLVARDAVCVPSVGEVAVHGNPHGGDPNPA